MLDAAVPVSSEICFAPKLHFSLVVSKGAAVVSLEVSISSLSSPGRKQDKHFYYTNIVQYVLTKYQANCSLYYSLDNILQKANVFGPHFVLLACLHTLLIMY